MLASSSSESLSQQQQNAQLIKSPQHEIKEQHNEQHLDLNSSEAIKLNRDRTEAIQAEINSMCRISPQCPIQDLYQEYLTNESWATKICQLIDVWHFQSYVKVRRDGNCFYRCISFCLLKMLVDSHTTAPILKKAFQEPIDYLTANFDYRKDFLDDFLEQIFEAIDEIDASRTYDKLFECLNHEYLSDTIVSILRYIVACELLRNEQEYVHFICSDSAAAEHPTMASFLRSEVEALGRDADNVQISALTNIMHLRLRLFALDASHAEGMTIEFGEGVSEPLNQAKPFDLLFVPGHYEIIY